jgi:hypothetical protein
MMRPTFVVCSYHDEEICFAELAWTARYSAVVIVAIGTTAILSNNNSANPEPDAHCSLRLKRLSKVFRVQSGIASKAMRRCYMDILLFAPRSAKYVLPTPAINIITSKSH